jgi:hypothetical protein
MKILQKNILIRYFNIGINLIILILISSCNGGEIEYLLTTNFKYQNTTAEKVNIILFDENGINFNTYSIDPNEEIDVSLLQEGGKTGVGQPFAFGNSTEKIATQVIIEFETSNKCLANSTILNVEEYDNFTESMCKTSNNTLIYNIDQEELDLATTCE